jgi:hypothetical protein
MLRKTLVIALVMASTSVGAVAEEKPILVVYDFTSTFDKGKMGGWIAEIVRGHAIRSRRYIGNPKITVDEILTNHGYEPDVTTSPAKLAKFTRDAFAADLFVYGSVAKRGEDDYQVHFRVYRATAEGTPEKIIDETRDCPGKRYIPLAVDKVLDTAAGVKDWKTEWTLLAGEMKKCSAELLAEAADAGLSAVDWRQKVIGRQGRYTYRWRNVIGRSNFDFASKPLLDYVQEVTDRHLELQKELTGGDPAKAHAKARDVAKLAGALARSIEHWLDTGAAEKRWKTGKNLVINGDFETGQLTPTAWEPLKEHMSWVRDPDGKSGKVVKFDMPQNIAATYGMLLYSRPIEIETGATYRLRWRFKTQAPAVKLFIKGYNSFTKEFGFKGQNREVWRSRKDPQHGPRVKNEYKRGEWTEYGHDFVPFAGKTDARTGRFLRYPKQPKYLRLMLYAYWPKGVVYWDDIVVKKMGNAPERPK